VRPETEALIGFFAYPLVLRSDLSGDPTFRELLARVRQVTLGAYAHQALPLSQVMELARPARNPAHHPLFQVMFGFLDRPLGVLEAAGLRFTPLTMGKGATDFDLFMSLFQDQEGLRGLLEYNADLFEAQTAAHLVRAYVDFLAQCVQHPATRLSQLALPGALEEQAKQARARQRQDTLSIAATFTAEPVEESLAFWMQKLDLPAQVVFAPYNQVFQQLLDPASLLSQNETGVNVVLVRFEDWQRFQDGDEANAAETIERNAQDLVAALKTAAERSSAPYLVCVCPPAPDADAGRLAFFQRLETRLAAELEAVSGVYVVTSAELAALYPVAEYYDAYADELGHVPYTARFFTALGTMIVRRVYALRQPPRKVIVLDCDQTLWQGVCGEDGALGVQIDSPRRALQEFMVAQGEAGMLLCLCSKNNEEDVWDVFARREEMVLRREHLVAWRVNWRPKSENLRALAEELQLGLDSFILLDDNPVECAEVQANCPEVLTLQLPQEPARIARFLQHVWVFDRLKVTDEDRQRTVFYQQNLARERLQQQALTFEAFLEGLELEVQIGAMTSAQLPRVAQLTQRTNQFNVTTIRRSERELQQLCESGHECLAVQVRDRFGDYGLVGVMLFEVKTGAIRVDTFLLSCRTLGRGVEHRMLVRLGEIAQARSLDRVEVPFVPTKKNQPALDFLEAIGGAFKESRDGDLFFHLPAQLAATLTPVHGR
jgi:FkbH-like protein